MKTASPTTTVTLVRKKLDSPVDLLALWANSQVTQKAYWAIPEQDFEFVALGVCASFKTNDRRNRFQRIRQLIEEVEINVEGDAGPEFSAGVLIGGFSFSNRQIERHPNWSAFGGGELVLPEIFAIRSGKETWITRTEGSEIPDLNGTLSSDLGWTTKPDHQTDPAYLRLVSSALREIEAGLMDKVVTARSLTISADLSAGAVLRRLKQRHPSCATFAFTQGSQVFLGASPERLVGVDQDRVETAALAGSRPRHEHPGADARLRAELLADPKERREHEIVIRDIKDCLNAAGVRLNEPITTGVMKLRQIQHLHTPISGSLPTSGRILDLVEVLHPTPAVAGLPRESAQDWIDDNEAMDRGWYAAPIGWMTLNGSGEFRVALRSALLTRDSLTLFAGGGIVKGATPAQELAETATKFEALLGALDLSP